MSLIVIIKSKYLINLTKKIYLLIKLSENFINILFILFLNIAID